MGFVAFLHGLLQSELAAVTQLPHALDLCADVFGQQSGVNCVLPSLPAAAQKHPNPSGAKLSGIS